MNIIQNLGIVLNDDESQILASSIKDVRDIWTHESVYWGKERSEKPIYFLGSPIYAAKSDPGLYKKLRNKTDKFLIDHTSNLLKRTLELISKFYECPIIEQLDDTSLPGFHVLHKEKPHSEKYTYHQDKDYLEYYADFNVAKPYQFDNFYSFIVPIEVPKSGATLDFKIEDQSFSFKYEVGHAYIWKADVWHKIGDVALNGDDYRITFQGHFIIDADKILYYW